ncbi:MAG: OsmC family peroxiredoxin [Actinomycetota bacterium]|nr:OsmC family peroxiredoxin [Actinomycetota bacterium]
MTADNVLGAEARPRFFAFNNHEQLGLHPPALRRGVAIRTFVRSLAGMQKEALVVSSANRQAWRLVSDEGPYLAGHDEAPFPLAFLTAGMVASYADEIVALARLRDVALTDLRLTLDNFYTMEGSAVRGTMIGGALPPELQVACETEADVATLRNLCADAVEASALNGLLRGQNTSLFTLVHNGGQLSPGKVSPLDSPAEPGPADRYEEVTVDGPNGAEQLMARIASAELREGEGGTGSSLHAEQKRTLHVRGICTLRPDGLRAIEVQLFRPIGSNFRFLSEGPLDSGEGRAPGAARDNRAPDAATLISAGIAFCFMTQLGRYATITKRRLDRYRIIQDTHFSPGGASGHTGKAGQADPVETHLYLDTPEDAGFARTLLDMGEQTCFLHALCRTDLKPKVTLSPRGAAV